MNFHLVYPEGMGIHWRLWRGWVAWSDLCRACIWNAAYKKGRCWAQENHGVGAELSVHGDTRPERKEEARIYGRNLKTDIMESRPEPGQRPELGLTVSLEGDQEEFLLDSLCFRCLHPLTVGYESLILPGELQVKDTNLKLTECRWQLIPWKMYSHSGQRAGLTRPFISWPLLTSQESSLSAPPHHQGDSPLQPYCNSWISPARSCWSTCRPFLRLSLLVLV